MRYHCSRCHHVLTTPADKQGGPHECPQCKAEAGLEPEAAVPAAARVFSALLLAALVASAAFGALTLASGAG